MTNAQLYGNLGNELKDLEIPAKLRRKRGCIQLTEKDMRDERIQYIINK